MGKFNKNWIGRKVKMVNAELHEEDPQWYPAVGSVGTVVLVGNNDWAVQWSKDSGVDEDGIDGAYTWFCEDTSLELVDDTLTPYDEIWKMLKPKMEKNGLHSYICRLFNYEVEKYERTEFYTPEDFQKAVALAYKIGYERAMKGRPFKYGEKKVKKVESHWEKVDPENLPKDGTRVRYARSDGGKHIYDFPIGQEGVFKLYENSYPALLDENDHWFIMTNHEDSLDYWVEGDDAD